MDKEVIKMDKETLDFLEICIFAEQTYDINFQNVAKELFKDVYKLSNIIDRAINYIKAVGVLPGQIDSYVLLNILQGDYKSE